MKKKPLEIDMIAGSQLLDTQGEILSIEGADISDLQRGLGRLNDNHGSGAFNSIGRITYAKKIFKPEDCTTDRERYYWEKVKAPYLYVKGILYDDTDHPNARAAAAILRHIHKADAPLKLKASVEGGVIARGTTNPSLLARTKIHSVALTFVPANNATLVEPINLDKSDINKEADYRLIKSVEHLAQTNVPSFRSITRHASADKIINNTKAIIELANQLGLSTNHIPDLDHKSLIKGSVEQKITSNINKINKLVKALTAGYGGASSPTDMTGGAVIQSESLEPNKFKYITCHKCGKEQIYHTFQVKCRSCDRAFPLEQLLDYTK
jgi:predicted nucleic-acid-binding Zn-ribbon protein